jgi:3'(2'), 5'-bisphosphate nucleotidase
MMLEQVLTIAVSAGTEIMRLRPTAAVTAKSDGSPVTDGDLAANAIITDALQKFGYPILSEESHPPVGVDPEYLWVIDPIDGTKSYIHGGDDFAVMIGLLHRGIPILGVVHAPGLEVTYFSERDGGAYKRTTKGDTLIRVSDISDPLVSKCLRGSSRLNSAASTTAIDSYLTAIGAGEIIPRHGMGVKLCLIADGSADFMVTKAGLGEWDVCAGQAILAEAGGVVSDLAGNAILYGNEGGHIQNGLIASNTALFSSIVGAVARVDLTVL